MTSLEPLERLPDETIDDPVLDRIVLVLLLVFLLAVVLIPSEWLLKWSMWWSGLA